MKSVLVWLKTLAAAWGKALIDLSGTKQVLALGTLVFVWRVAEKGLSLVRTTAEAVALLNALLPYGIAAMGVYTVVKSVQTIKNGYTDPTR